MKENNSVYKEAFKVCSVIFVLGIIELVLFTIFLSFRADILLGTVYGCLFVCLNFFYLAHSVKKAASKSGNGAKAYMASTYTSRMLLTAVMILVAAKVSQIHFWAAIIPLFFQRVAATIVPFINKRSEKS